MQKNSGYFQFGPKTTEGIRVIEARRNGGFDNRIIFVKLFYSLVDYL